MMRRVYREVAQIMGAQPLILSFSLREKGRLNSPRSMQHRPLSHRDRVRGCVLRYCRTWAAACVALTLLVPAPANAWSLWNEMIEQISIKPQEKPLPFPQRSVPVPGTATMRVQDQDSASALVNPVKPTAESVNAGRQLYGIYCTPCHGASGTGNGLVGEKLSVKPFDLTSEAVQSLSDGFIFGYLTFRGTVMPSYANDLSPTERWHMINYLRHGLTPATPQQAGIQPNDQAK
jgi:S-disulfanyl-L-cysteine oxidoreductase SoxD